MFDQLQDRFESGLKKIRGLDKLSEVNISEGLRDVRLSLLEADVNYKVVKEFIQRVKEKSIGQITIKSVKPGQQIIKIVHDELIQILGGLPSELHLGNKDGMGGILVCGLQGSGKTTTCAKLANYLIEKKGLKPLLVAADTQRPAAIDQLKTLGASLNIPVFSLDGEKNPVVICQAAFSYAKKELLNVCIYDTAGRLHVDEILMEELIQVQKAINPQEVLLVADSMMGQDAVKVAENFLKAMDLTGIILTKTDGDARGGAALSMSTVVQKPIKFIGTGEKTDKLEMFYPDRIASRILGMGDVVSMVEKAQDAFDQESAIKLEQKIKEQSFDLEDFLQQLQQLKKMGPLQDLLGMIPGMGKMKGMNVDEKQLVGVEAIIQSMTNRERKNPQLIDGSRKRRIAKGSGRNTQQVNQLLKQFSMMKKMMKNMGQMQKKFSKFKLPF